MSCRLKDFRRVAPRYDKRADTRLSAVLIAAAVACGLNRVPTLRADSLLAESGRPLYAIVLSRHLNRRTFPSGWTSL